MTKGRIAKNGLRVGEKVVFSWKGDVIYLGVARSGLEPYEGEQKWDQPYEFGFRLELGDLWRASGTLRSFERRVREKTGAFKNIVQTQGWPRLDDSGELDEVWNEFKRTQVVVSEDFRHGISDVEEPSDPVRIKCTNYRILRDTPLARQLKVLYEHSCQICGESIELPDGRKYAEAHHVQPLGAPHGGPDIDQNIIVVCPNHHAMLDLGAIRLRREELRLQPGHDVGQQFIDYHNNQIYLLRDSGG